MGIGNMIVTEAHYGTETKSSDVTAIVSKKVLLGNSTILVNNNTMQGDPHFGVRKTLTVTYYEVQDGSKILTKSALEGESLDLSS